MRKLRRRRSLLLAGWIVLFGMPVLSAQVPNQKPTREKQKRALGLVSISVWRKWLNEDVAYIITDQERGDFATLTSEQQRDQFITDFWERRNPNPGSPENAFKDEHYRRFAYANEHFATKLPGWKTDRGRIYIIYGPPDQVDNHFSAAGSESARAFSAPARSPTTGSSGTIDTSTVSERTSRSSS
jgi:GWxTD domain-containing protein